MFQRAISLVMVFCFGIATANAGSTSGLKSAIDELNYALNVEWDQQDQKVLKAKSEAFSRSLEKLKAEGLTNADIVAFLKSEINDEAFSKNLDTTLDTISMNAMTAVEAQNFINDSAKRIYASGASWTRRSDIYFGVAAFAVIVTFLTISQLERSAED